MKNFKLNEYGVQEMSHAEVKEVDGGLLVTAVILASAFLIGFYGIHLLN